MHHAQVAWAGESHRFAARHCSWISSRSLSLRTPCGSNATGNRFASCAGVAPRSHASPSTSTSNSWRLVPRYRPMPFACFTSSKPSVSSFPTRSSRKRMDRFDSGHSTPSTQQWYTALRPRLSRSSTLMKDASKLAIVDLSDKSPNIYRYAFGDCRGFPAPLNGAMDYLCDRDACPDPTQFKKMRGAISYICHELTKACLDSVGMKPAVETVTTRASTTRQCPIRRRRRLSLSTTWPRVETLHLLSISSIETSSRLDDIKQNVVDIGWAMLSLS